MGTPTGSGRTQLVVLRGNSGSGKSSIATALRELPMSVVQQDHVRRIMLKEHDGNEPGALTPRLLDQVVRFCLDHGKDVVLEGILYAAKYRPLITALLDDHVGANHVYYLDIPFDETVRRHDTRPERDHFTAEDMRDWYHPHDALDIDGEIVIGPESSQEQTLSRITSALETNSRRAM